MLVMQDWTTLFDLVWLVVGLVPVIFVAWRTIVFGVSSLIALDSIFIGSTWLGYHLSPWLAIFSGYWASRELVFEYVTVGLAFSCIAMYIFMAAYGAQVGGGRGSDALFDRIKRALYIFNPNLWLVLALSLASFGLTVLMAGNIGTLWDATLDSIPTGSITASPFFAKIGRILVILASNLAVAVAILGGLLLFKKNRSLADISVGLLAIVAATLPRAFDFSRFAGYAFIIAALIGVYKRQSKALSSIVILFLLGVWLSWTGWASRSEYPDGVANFAVAMFDVKEADSSILDPPGKNMFVNPSHNPLNAIDRFTTRAWTKSLDSAEDAFDGLKGLVLALQPFPSVFVSFRVQAGQDLEDVLGVKSHQITTPAFGELYYWFGLWGLAFIYPAGRFSKWADRRRVNQGSIISLLLWGSVALGFAIGLHSGVRAMTRAIVYMLVIDFVLKYVDSVRKKRDTSAA